MMWQLIDRDARAGEALALAARDDVDELVRQVAQAAVDGRRRDVRPRKALRRRAKKNLSATPTA
jgi:hypothetical protein